MMGLYARSKDVFALFTGVSEKFGIVQLPTAAWLAQLVERQSAEREVEGSSPRPDQHSGS